VKLLDETSSKLELVDIPLSFGADTPDVPLPAAK
jgi:hypothetical protein